MHIKEMRSKSDRYYRGIALNEAGLKYHKTGFESLLFEGKIATATSPEKEVNSLIPSSWDDRKSVIAMRAHHSDGDPRAVLDDAGDDGDDDDREAG